MNFSVLLQNRAYIAQNTKSAIYAFSDYISSQLERLQDFVTGGKPNSYISIPIERSANDEALNKVVVMSFSEVDKAMSDETAVITGIVSDTQETVSMTGGEVYERLQDTICDLKAQSCFLHYCLEAAEATAEGFLTRISSLTDGIPGYIKDKYMQFITNGGNALNAISSFLSTRVSEPELLEDQYISVVDFDEYTGNVWEAAWTIIVEDITYCFKDVIWQGLLHIGEFLKSIWNGIAKLIKWGLTALFGDLFTSFETVSKGVQGILDLPFFQFDLGLISNISGTNTPYLDYTANFLNRIKNGFNDSTQYLYSGFSNFRWTPTGILNSFYGFDNLFMQSIIDLVTSFDQDGLGMRSITDIPIPLDDDYFDFVIRFGFESTGHLIMAGYPVLSGSTLKNVGDNDGEIFRHLASLPAKVIKAISYVAPMIWSEPYYTDWSSKLSLVASALMPEVSTSATEISEMDFLSQIKYKFARIDDNTLSAQDGTVRSLFNILMYCCIMSKGFHHVTVGNDSKLRRGEDRTNEVFGYLYTTINLYQPSAGSAEPETILDNEDLDIDFFSKQTFKPYMVRDVLPVTVHFQTVDERAKEIIVALRAILIVAVAVFITVKIVKTKKNFTKKLFEATAARDQFSWDLAKDPNNPAKRALFDKAYSKARKLNFFGRIIGVSSQAVASEALSSFSLTKQDIDNKAVYQLISGKIQ